MNVITTLNERTRGDQKLAGKGLSVLAVKQREEIIATLGGASALSPIDLIRVDMAVRMLQRSRRRASAEDMVRLNNAAVKIIDGLAARKAKSEPAHAPMRSELAAELVQR
jgi:hypothetical protein